MSKLIMRFAAVAMVGMLCMGGAQASGTPHKSKRKADKTVLLVLSSAPRFVDFVDMSDLVDDVPALMLERGGEGMQGSLQHAVLHRREFPAVGGQIFLRDTGRLDDEHRHWLVLARFVRQHDFTIPTVVPEADTALMLALGLPLTLLLARRKRSA